MPRRYCGSLTISLTINDWRSRYDVTVSATNASDTWKSSVGFPAYLTQPIASSEALDDAARAALSFLADEEERGETGADLIQYADWDDSGPFVARARLEAA